jgi:hypothetical protein
MRDRNLRDKLNLSYLEVAEKTYSAGPFDFPVLWCPYSKALEIDYIALYDDISEYKKTDRTAIAFFQYDSVWNGQNGLFVAIYYNDKKRLAYYKKRFSRSDGKPFVFIEPDVSHIGGVHSIENLYRYFQARIIANWLIIDCGAVVIPNLTASSGDYFKDMISGLETTEVAAINTVGHLSKPKFSFSLEMARYALENLKNLKLIIVYTASKERDEIKKKFENALNDKIKVLVPLNRLSARNEELSLGVSEQ